MAENQLPQENARDDGEPSGKPAPPAVKFEATDLSFSPVLVTVLLLGILLFAVSRASRWLLARLPAPAASSLPSEFTRPALPLPAPPRLEALEIDPSAAASWNASQRATQAALHRYGRTSEPGFVHIPIEQAMQILAQQLPTDEQRHLSDGRSQGLVGGGDSNSGRVLRGSPP